MADFSHKMARIAFSKAIDVMLNRIYRDRQKGMLQLVDVVEKYVGNMFSEESYARIRSMMTDQNEKWNQYVCRLIDELFCCLLREHALFTLPVVKYQQGVFHADQKTGMEQISRRCLICHGWTALTCSAASS